jgi:polyisoprenoid-binding protein YceI
MRNALIILFSFSILFSAEGKAYSVDFENATLKWTANRVTKTHWGYILMKGGNIVIDGKNIISGDFQVDMNSIVVRDMDESPWRTKLENHLKSSDFFYVEKFPTSQLTITKVSFNQGAFKVVGDLTIRGITHSVEFPAIIKFSDSGPRATGQIKINRTLFDVNFRSGTFFTDLGDKMIYDEFTIDFEVKAD